MIEKRNIFKKFKHKEMIAILNRLSLESACLTELKQLNYDMAIFNSLLDMGAYQAAAKFLASGLPKREAIWWGFISAEAQAGQDNKTVEIRHVVENWVKSPTEEKRKQIGELLKNQEDDLPMNLVAKAVFWSGGSIAKQDKPAVESSQYMYADAIYNALLLASAERSENANEALQNILRRGIHIAMGGNGRV